MLKFQSLDTGQWTMDNGHWTLDFHTGLVPARLSGSIMTLTKNLNQAAIVPPAIPAGLNIARSLVKLSQNNVGCKMHLETRAHQ